MDVKDLTEKEFVEQIGRPAVTQKKKTINRHRLPVLRKDFDKSIKKRALHMRIT